MTFMDSYIIQLHPQDELTVVIDKIIHTQAGRIYLLIPDKSRIAQHGLNFRLLKREADIVGKEIVVVSASPRVQTLALKASLQAHQETQAFQEGARTSQDIFSKSPKVEDIVEPLIPPEVTRAPGKRKKSTKEEKSSAAREEKIKSFWTKELPLSPRRTFEAPRRFANFLFSIPTFKMRRVLFFRGTLFLLAGVSIAIAGVTFYSVLPRAKVYVTPLAEDIILEARLVGKKGIQERDSENLFVPVQIFEYPIQASKTVPSSGKKEIKDKAAGEIKVYNAYSSAPQTLVATTRFVSDAGKLFRTAETVVVPGAEVDGGRIAPRSIALKVIASNPGEEYNIGPSTFSIPGFKGTPKYLGFYGQSETPMIGGRIGTVEIIAEDDYRNAADSLARDLKDRASKELSLSLPDGFIIPEGAHEFSPVEIVSTKKSGEEAKEFSVSGSISSKVFSVREVDIRGALEEDFRKRFPGKTLAGENEEVTYETLTKNFQNGIIDFKATLKTTAVAKISREEIGKGVYGKNEREVRAFLSAYPLIKEARVTFWPFWVHRMPDDPSKIEIITP